MCKIHIDPTFVFLSVAGMKFFITGTQNSHVLHSKHSKQNLGYTVQLFTLGIKDASQLVLHLVRNRVLGVDHSL